MPARAATLRRRTFEILEVAHAGDRTSRWVDRLLIALIAANVLAVVLESVASIHARFATGFAAFEAVSVGIFTLEYLLRIWSCVERTDARESLPLRARAHYAATPLALCDLLAILPFYLAALVGMDLRFLRVLRLLRIFKLTRYSSAMSLMLKVFRHEARAFGVALFVLLVVMVLASSGIYLVEHEAQPQAFGSIPAAMWWAVATLTTVGYGDVTPVTPLGKFFGACITIAGIGMVALPSGILASGFSDQLSQRRRRFEQEVEEVLEDGHLSIADRRRLVRLRQELDIDDDDALALLKQEAKRIRAESAAHCPHCGKSLR